MIKRSVEPILKEALSISPAVLLIGARQVGKSTLALNLDTEYRVFDDLTQREAALSDPIGYVNSLPKPICLDEIQKVPVILDAIKLNIDKDRKNGNFLLTGSANVLDMKKAKESLTGRVIEIELWGFSQKELNGKPNDNVIDSLFEQNIENLKYEKIKIDKIYQAIINGGYPQIQQIHSPRGKKLWFDSYISTYIERDIRDIGELRDIASFIKFYNILMPNSSYILKKSTLSNSAGISEVTVNNYLKLLELIYQISFLQPYSSNISKRFIKSPKIYLNDSGLLSHILNIRTIEELVNSQKKGEIVETFIYSEIKKHINYSQTQPQLFYYRTNDKKEIDFIIEKNDRIFAIEVKSSQSVKKEYFKHIIDFQKKSTKDITGIVFYLGDDIVAFSTKPKLYAVPIALFF